MALPSPNAPTVNLQAPITQLMQIHRTQIVGSTSVEYLNRFGSPRAASYQQGSPSRSLIYQLKDGPGSEVVVVAINFGNSTLKVTQEIAPTTNVNPGAVLQDLTGNAFQANVTLQPGNQMLIDVPARSYAVTWLTKRLCPPPLVALPPKPKPKVRWTCAGVAAAKWTWPTTPLRYQLMGAVALRRFTARSHSNGPPTMTTKTRAPGPAPSVITGFGSWTWTVPRP
ncbi:MAG: hypothetical protein HC821_04230 [Lewinella sp.]|nr:hypothetical protein [Lewinella sp.]